MSCPQCGLRQWHYDETTLTCKNGHRVRVGDKPPVRLPPLWLIPVTAAGTLVLDFLVRTIT